MKNGRFWSSFFIEYRFVDLEKKKSEFFAANLFKSIKRT